jgi:maltose alpha-D-glucosyltransferase/alpha-amylase
MNSLLFSMPGTPIIYYGDEIGMGDNVFLGDRNGVRTPMQWTPDRNAGFSRSDPAGLYLPPIMDAIYGYQAVNVEAQTRTLSSLLNWMKRLIGVRQSLRVFGRGTLTFLYPTNRAVIAYLRQYEDTTVLCVANLSRSAQAAQLDLSKFVGRVPMELMGQSEFPPIAAEGTYTLTLQGYGFYWFQLNETPQAAKRVLWQPDLFTLIVQGTQLSIVEGRNRQVLELDILPTYLRDRRWFAHKHAGAIVPHVSSSGVFSLAGRQWIWLLTSVDASKESTATYSLPLVDSWDASARTIPANAIAKLRRGAQGGFLIDALRSEEFVSALAATVRAGGEISTADGRLIFQSSTAWSDLPWPDKPVVRIGDQEQSNSSAIIEDTLILKAYRRVAPGIHPEIEIGGYLTDRARFPNVPAFLGSIHLETTDRGRIALAVLHRLVRNQGDGWTYTSAYLDRFLQETRITPVTEKVTSSEAHAAYLVQIETLAKRTAELHRALAPLQTDDPSFTTEHATSESVESWGSAVVALADEMIGILALGVARLSQEDAAIAADVIKEKTAVQAHIRRLAHSATPISISRHHGDYHLGQILIAQNEIFIVDFEGPPQVPLERRRAKHSVLRDAAGMLRSFDYAAWTALDRATLSQPDRRNELAQAVLLWRQDVTDKFLKAYMAAMAGSHLLPDDEDTVRRLLSLFLLEKAAMETMYELAQRPSWVGVPLRGFKALIAS